MGLFTALALPTAIDRADFVANGTLARYSFSHWSWDGAPWRDALALLAFALVQRVLTFGVLCTTKKLRFT